MRHATPIPNRLHGARRRAGLTLIELMLGLAITAVIALAISSMLFAATHATSAASDLRTMVMKQKLVTARMDTSLRGSHMVLAKGSNYIVVWMTDSTGDGAPNLSELRRIEYDSTAHTITSYRMPASFTAAQVTANDISYTLTDDFNAKTTTAKGTTGFPAETWSTSAYGFSVTLDNATVQSALLISYQVTIQSGTQQAVAIGAAALRS